MVSAAEDICLYTTWHCIRCMDNYYSTRQSISIETSPKHNNSPSKLKRCDSGRGSKGVIVGGAIKTSSGGSGLDRLECTARHPGSGGIVSVTMPLWSIKELAVATSLEQGPLRMTHHYVNEGWNRSSLFIGRERSFKPLRPNDYSDHSTMCTCRASHRTESAIDGLRTTWPPIAWLRGGHEYHWCYCKSGPSMCTCPTRFCPRGANATKLERLQTWHVHKCVLLGDRIQGLKGLIELFWRWFENSFRYSRGIQA